MIAIYEDTTGEYRPDDYVPTGLYDDGEWVAGGDVWSDFYPEGTPEEVIAGQLDGPSAVAVEVTEGSDELAAEIEKDHAEPGGTTTDMGVMTDVENDSDPKWTKPRHEREDAEKAQVKPTQATLMSVGDEVTVVDDEGEVGEDIDEEKSDGERVYVDSVHDVPEGKTVQMTVDEEGDVDEVYYES